MGSAKLKYTFKSDVLFKMLFVQYPDLLKKLIAELLNIQYESIGELKIKNPDIPPELIDGKYCRLDINMMVDGQLIDLEIQVEDEGDYPERSLYYWAREFSTTLASGGEYKDLPRTIIISILRFKLFDCEEFHSEFMALEITRHTPLSDRFCMHFFELPKLPEEIRKDDNLKLWLALFKAETEEDIAKIKEMEVPIMEQAIEAYEHITATEEFQELERQRHYARIAEASAIGHAVDKVNEKWQSIVAEKDIVISEKDAALAEQAALIAKLKAKLGESN